MAKVQTEEPARLDNRSWYLVKSNYGFLAYALLIILNGFEVALPYIELFSIVTTWTGYSVAERFRK